MIILRPLTYIVKDVLNLKGRHDKKAFRRLINALLTLFGMHLSKVQIRLKVPSGDIVPQTVVFLNPVAGPEGYLFKTFIVRFFEIFFQRKFLTAIHAVEGYDPSTDNQLDLPAAGSTFHIF